MPDIISHITAARVGIDGKLEPVTGTVTHRPFDRHRISDTARLDIRPDADGSATQLVRRNFAPYYADASPLEQAARALLEASSALREADRDAEDAAAALEASQRAQELARQAVHEAQTSILTITSDAR